MAPINIPDYIVQVRRDGGPLKLKVLCDYILSAPEFVQRDITADGKEETFCNRAVRYVSYGMGCMDFSPDDSANIMVDVMADKWRKATAEEAIFHARNGGLAVAGKRYPVHGHVAVLYPDPGAYSGSWGHIVPLVANVGVKPNKVKKTSEAFPVKDKKTGAPLPEPDYFIWDDKS